MLVTAVATFALVVIIAAALSACGGSSVAGTYKYESGSEKMMADFKLTLNDDETMALSRPNPLGGDDVTVKGTFAVDGDKLVFTDVTWVKE